MKAKIAVIAAVALLTLTGCSDFRYGEVIDTSGNSRNGESFTYYQDLPDGTKVLCVYAYGNYGGGVTCDWAHKTVDIGEGK